MKRITLLFGMILSTLLCFAQQPHKKIKINNADENTIYILASNGIDLHCGAVKEGSSLTLELSPEELQVLQQNGIGFDVKVDNLQQYYKQRAIKGLPIANAKLAQEKAKSKSKTTQFTGGINAKSVTNVVQDNIIRDTAPVAFSKFYSPVQQEVIVDAVIT